MRRSFFIIVCSLLVGVCSAHAYVMGSDSYRIQTDAVDVAGGTQTSTSYTVRDTVGEISSGDSSSDNYKLAGGYIPMIQGGEISISTPDDLVMLPEIGAITGGTASGTISWTVTTDNLLGYYLAVKASASPALSSAGANFTDYITAVEDVPDFVWSIADNASAFGFTPEGTDVIQKFQDNAGVCNAVGGDTTAACWEKFLTTNQTIASSDMPNNPAGVTTVLRVQAQSGSTHLQTAGTYTATITATALAL